MSKIIAAAVLVFTLLSAICAAAAVWVTWLVGRACWRRWGPGNRNRNQPGSPHHLSVCFLSNGKLRIDDGGARTVLDLAGARAQADCFAAAEREAAGWIGAGPYRVLHLAAGDDLVRGSDSLVEHLVVAGWASPASGATGARYRECATLARARRRGAWEQAHASP